MKHLLPALLLSTALVACDTNDPNAPTLKEAAQESQRAIEAEQRPVNYIRETPVPGGLTPERINQAPSLLGTTLRGVKIAPNGEFVTVLQGREDDPAQQDLWAYDLETGEGRQLVSSTDLIDGPEILSEEEKNRRERAREYGSGIVSYSWVGENLLLFPLGGDIYLYDLETQESQQVTATKGFESDPKVSADGSTIAYVRENELFVQDLETGLERQISDGATNTIRNATASFVVQEELGRSTGYWLSPDAARVAYTQIDESPVAIENRIDFGVDGVTNIAQRYPFAGTDNATVKLGFASTTGGTTRWVALDDDQELGDDIYLTRVAWADDNMAYVGVMARNNKAHRIYKVNARNGDKTLFYEETSPTWLNIRSEFMPRGDGLLWITEGADKRQVFEISTDGVPSALTPPDLHVDSLLCRTDAALFVRGWRESPVSRHVFKVSGETVEQLSEGDGTHSARFNEDCTRYLGGHTADALPPNLRAFTSDGEPLAWLNENALDADHPYAPYLGAHINPEYGQITAEDGTLLDYALFKPKDLKAGEKRPSVTIVYAGPGVQRVQNRFARKQLANVLAHHGFVVFILDGRGAGGRGKVFEDHLYRKMGQFEVVDQTAGANWLKSQSFVDPENMGVYGWSYGGYMTLHMLAQTDLYKSGVSGAPVTDWALYDTAYTERFLGDPRPDHPNHTPGAYDDANVLTHIEGLTEPVLLIHGMADDNVVFRHSVVLMDAMQKKNRHNLRIQTYPGEKHGFRNTQNRIHRDRQILEFFSETLAPE